MTKLVIFDCDGVLIDSEPVACKVMAGVLSGLGFPLTERDLYPFIGRAGRETYAELEARHGMKMPDDIRARMHSALRVHLAEHGMAPMRGVADVIGALAAPACVASNSSHDYLELVLGTAGLYQKFPGRIFSSYDVARPKPAPDLFEHAARKIDADPERSVVIEDSVLGVSAGVAAGMTVIGFTGGGHCAPDHADKLILAGADIVCADMEDVADELAARGYIA